MNAPHGSANGQAPDKPSLDVVREHAEGALLAVETAVVALRRNATIVIGERASSRAIAVQTVESPVMTAALWPKTLAVRPPRLALTARRFKALQPTFVSDAEIVLLPLPNGITHPAIRSLADPCATMDPAIRKLNGLPWTGSGYLEAAAIKLMKLAGLIPAALVAELNSGIKDPGSWVTAMGLAFVQADAAFGYEELTTRSLRIVADARVPLTDAPDMRMVAFRPSSGGPEHLAIIVGRPDTAKPVLMRMHSACLTGDLLSSLRCDCGDQLRGAVRVLSQAGSGILLYLAQEGRGIGLVNKLRAYQLQDQGFDTVDANEQLGFELDERSYAPAAEMLRQLGYHSVRLMTNNPAKVAALHRLGIDVVERVPHAFSANEHNRAYLRTKALRSGHILHAAAEAETGQADPMPQNGVRDAPSAESRITCNPTLKQSVDATPRPLGHGPMDHPQTIETLGSSTVRPSRGDVEASVRTLIAWAGDDPDRPGLERTPTRVAEAYGELFAGYHTDPATPLRRSLMPDEGDGRLVLLRDIRFVSFCEHHLLPFVGHVHVGYLPRRHVVGIGAIAAAVDALARRLQIQERLTDQLMSILTEVLDPLGLAIVVDALHQCAAARGPKVDARLVTSRQLGALAADNGLGGIFHTLIAAPTTPDTWTARQAPGLARGSAGQT